MSTAIESPKSREVELAEELLHGNAAAFDEFVNIFQSKIFQYTLMMCGHREDAEEVAQDTLLKVFENFDQLQDARNVRAWVFRIARNACLMKRRKSVFAPKTELSLRIIFRARKKTEAASGCRSPIGAGFPRASCCKSS